MFNNQPRNCLSEEDDRFSSTTSMCEPQNRIEMIASRRSRASSLDITIDSKSGDVTRSGTLSKNNSSIIQDNQHMNSAYKAQLDASQAEASCLRSEVNFLR